MRRKIGAGALTAAALICLGVAVCEAGAVINEIHYAPAAAAAPELRFEYVEIYNNGPAALDLDGWALLDQSTGTTKEVLYVFASFQLTVGCYAVVYSSAATGTLTGDSDCADDGRAVLIAADWPGGRLANAGDAVYLYADWLTLAFLQDFVYYDEANMGDPPVDDEAVALGIWKDGAAIDTLSSGTTCRPGRPAPRAAAT